MYSLTSFIFWCVVKTVRKDERKYYEDLLQYSREHLMLYPYHLSDVIVKGLRITPFNYYIHMMQDIMQQEKSYDSLPNFTAADCTLDNILTFILNLKQEIQIQTFIFFLVFNYNCTL
jgi:hypothetical protein